MFLRKRVRKKNGKKYRYWSIVENRRLACGKSAQKHILYLGELNDAQRAGWVRAIDALDDAHPQNVHTQLALFPDDRTEIPALEIPIVKIHIDGIALHRPRQFGACWLAMHMWGGCRVASCSLGGRRIAVAEGDTITVFVRRRPEEWWGVLWMPEFWLVLGAGIPLALWAARSSQREAMGVKGSQKRRAAGGLDAPSSNC